VKYKVLGFFAIFFSLVSQQLNRFVDFRAFWFKRREVATGSALHGLQ
jgi:hypothetical protein